jgi:hypothetical protein
MRATDPIIRQRIEDVLRIRLDGAEGWDVRRYVAKQEAVGAAPWTVPEGGKPLSERQKRNYVTAADKLIDESCRQSRKKLLRRHLAQRRNLYARAVNKGDERTALAVLRDLAELQGLYPPAKLKAQHTGAKGGPIHHEVKADHEHHLDADPTAWPPSSEHLRRLPPASLERLARLATPRLTKYIPHKPHPRQAAFLLLDGREAMYGGSAGGGKSVALLMGALQYVDCPGYHALILRRTFAQLS